MATPKFTKPEWLVIAPDFEGATEKRLEVRPQHLAGLGEDPEDVWLWGGEFSILVPFAQFLFQLRVLWPRWRYHVLVET